MIEFEGEIYRMASKVGYGIASSVGTPAKCKIYNQERSGLPDGCGTVRCTQDDVQALMKLDVIGCMPARFEIRTRNFFGSSPISVGEKLASASPQAA